MARYFQVIAYLALCTSSINGIVVQRPAVISQPIPKFCKALASNATNISDPNLSFNPELPPSSFAVDLKFTSGFQDLDKLNVWLSIVVDIGRMSLNPWNQGFTGDLTFPMLHNVELKIKSSINAPHYQTKSVVWTLQDVYREYNRRGQYTSASFITRVGDHVLGFGSIKNTLGSANQEQSHSSPPAALTAISLPGTQLGRGGFDFRLDYKPSGAIFNDKGFFTMIIDFLVLLANSDPKSQTVKNVSVLNQAEGYVVEIRPNHEDDDLKLSTLIQMLGMLPEKMFQAGSRSRMWAELTGDIRYNGVKIAKVRIEKGDVGGAMNSTGTSPMFMTKNRLLDPCSGSNSTIACS